MAKRFIFPQQYGERKKAKLDISISDHNFPLSQNPSSSKDSDQSNNWGDDNDDEILLLASQACEEAFKDPNMSIIPNYSMCMQPSSTSTQIYEPNSSSSASQFSFKKPVSNTVNVVSTKLKDKCERISSPLPGMSKAYKCSGFNLSDDIIINDKNKDLNSDNLYRQLLELQEENKKLKGENGELLEKYVTKEGEASILRTQLKTSQASVDNVRLEKIKAQEKAQIDWSDKLAAANNKLLDLRTQLDIKNLDLISMKEKCKILESQKVKLTQVMLPTSDISMSQRQNNTIYQKNDTKSFLKKTKTVSNSVQTENKSYFLKLSIPQREELSKLTVILPLIMEPTENQYSILDYNEKLKLHTNIQNKFRIFSTFHRFPVATGIGRVMKKNINLQCIYEDISYIATLNGKSICIDRYLNILKMVKDLINEVQTELELVSHRTTTAFQKQMDEKYIEVTSNVLVVEKRDLLCGRALYKEEQAILARRMTAILCYILEYSPNEDIIKHLLERDADRQTHSFISDINKICQLLDSTTTAILYSGFLLSITHLLKVIHKHMDKVSIINILKTMISSRPMLFVSSHVLELLLNLNSDDFQHFCLNNVSGDLKVDYDQGVLLFRKDSCPLQILLRQMEAKLKCIGKEQLLQQAVDDTRHIILLYNRLKPPTDNTDSEQLICSCQLIATQVLVHALKICSAFLGSNPGVKSAEEALATCTSGLQALQPSTQLLQLGTAEGHLLCFFAQLRGGLEAATTDSMTADIHRNMLSETTSSLQSVEEEPQSYSSKAWLGALQTLSIAD